MNIDWEDIEERLAYLEDKPDCIPEDIREWTKFREQYENALEWMKDWKRNDFSKPNMTEEFLEQKLHEIGCLGYGFKKSIFEVLNDGKMNLMPELDWKTIENFELFFDWDYNLEDKNLIVLPPVPKHVGGDFWCPSNQLTSLKGAPQYVGGRFNCCYNQLTTLEGAPQHVGRRFYCHYNQLTSLKGAPQHIGGDFRCNNNQLTTLEGGPQHVDGDFWCHTNKLTTLKGAPQYVSGEFWCWDNNLPKSIPGTILSIESGKYINIKESIILSFKDFKKL